MAEEEVWENWSSDEEAGGGDKTEKQDENDQFNDGDDVGRSSMQVSARFLQEVFDLVKVRRGESDSDKRAKRGVKEEVFMTFERC